MNTYSKKEYIKRMKKLFSETQKLRAKSKPLNTTTAELLQESRNIRAELYE